MSILPCSNVIYLIISLHDIQFAFWFATPYSRLSPSGYREQHSRTCEANVARPILYFRQSIIFLCPTRVLLLFNSWSGCLETVFGINEHLHLKDFEILRQTVYDLQHDKPGLTPSASDLWTLNVNIKMQNCQILRCFQRSNLGGGCID